MQAVAHGHSFSHAVGDACVHQLQLPAILLDMVTSVWPVYGSCWRVGMQLWQLEEEQVEAASQELL